MKKNTRRERKERAKRIRKFKIAGGVLLVFFCAFLVVGIGLYWSIHRSPDDIIRDNIYIGNTEVSGMTKEEAKKELEKQMELYGTKQIRMEIGDSAAEATLGELGVHLEDLDQYIEQALNYGRKGNPFSGYRKIKQLEKKPYTVQVKYGVDEEQSKQVLSERAVPLESPGVDAGITRENDQFIYTEAQEGWTVDIKGTIQGINKYLNDEWGFEEAVIQVATNVNDNQRDVEELKTIQDELGTYGTHAGGGDRWKNLEKGASMINGTVIMPGEEVSAHDMTAPYTEENGYYQATAYENGQVVDSIAGGICQVSTTLYNAVINAELEVTERAPHSMLVSYVDPSRDAAIAGDYKDLKFKNNYDTPIYIESYIDGNNLLIVKVYGKETRDPAREISFRSETLEVLEPKEGAKYIANGEKSIGYMEYTQGARKGREAQLVKIVKINGEVVEETVINTSTYIATQAIVSVGTASENASAKSVVQSAISSQDEEKIKQAITQAKETKQPSVEEE
ncbi:VanW family protein [Lachnospiraceae bacterium OttesenSCG-928-E19]|nr:VanW family protein [Lachnospiraceae bacterium OttesenSCG-928-E19]